MSVEFVGGKFEHQLLLDVENQVVDLVVVHRVLVVGVDVNPACRVAHRTE